MDTKSWISGLMLFMIIYNVNSDFAQDKKLCQDQLVSLSPCISFVTGDAKSPSLTCCTELQKDVAKSKLCLCILVKDRNEPSLGFKLNATLALSLIPICRIHTNTTDCPELLHLAPNSPEAQVFEQFNNSSGVGNSTSSGEFRPSSSNKLSVEVLRQAAINGVLMWVLLSLSISSI